MAMFGAPDDPPKSLAEAEELFGKFLSDRGLPTRIVWVQEADVVFEHERSRLVDISSCLDRAYVEQSYQQGVAKDLGISLIAHCASSKHTFATIFVPDDAVDAQYHLMGRGLKLSCPMFFVSASFAGKPSSTRR